MYCNCIVRILIPCVVLCYMENPTGDTLSPTEIQYKPV